MSDMNTIKFRNASLSALCATATATILLLAPSSAWTKVPYTSDQLKMKNSEEVAALVNKKIKTAQDLQSKQTDDDEDGISVSPEAVAELRDGMRIILSRPDIDGGRSAIVSRVRNELRDLNSFEDVLKQLAKEAIAGVKKGSDSNIQTYLVLLDNMLMEFKPEVDNNKSIRSVIETIRDADIKVPERVIRMQRMKSMGKPKSPSDTAREILKSSKG
jgi:hypothetical protein